MRYLSTFNRESSKRINISENVMKKNSYLCKIMRTSLLTLVPAYSIVYASGVLDTSYDTDGKVTTKIGMYGGGAESIALQADGKAIVVGGVYEGFAVVRYNTDGKLDTTFDGDGKVMTDMSGCSDHVECYPVGVATDVAIQANGNIVVGGEDSATSRFLLARYQVNGNLDTTFDGDGKIMTEFASPVSGAQADSNLTDVEIQADGKIVAVGRQYVWTSTAPQPVNLVMARYLSNGSLDTSFGNAGQVNTNFWNYGCDLHNSSPYASVLSNGKILVAGGCRDFDTSINQILFVRYNSDGNLDATFGENGVVLTDIYSSGYAFHLTGIQDMTVANDGNIVVVGGAYNTGSSSEAMIASFTEDGSLNTSFAFGRGVVVLDFEGDTDYLESVSLQADGKIVATGFTVINDQYDMATVRLTSKGRVDRSFGTVITDFDGKHNIAYGMAIQNDGKIIIAGRSIAEDGNYNFALVRYLP